VKLEEFLFITSQVKMAKSWSIIIQSETCKFLIYDKSSDTGRFFIYYKSSETGRVLIYNKWN
jgi:hypothetical protein